MFYSASNGMDQTLLGMLASQASATSVGQHFVGATVVQLLAQLSGSLVFAKLFDIGLKFPRLPGIGLPFYASSVSDMIAPLAPADRIGAHPRCWCTFVPYAYRKVKPQAQKKGDSCVAEEFLRNDSVSGKLGGLSWLQPQEAFPGKGALLRRSPSVILSRQQSANIACHVSCNEFVNPYMF